MMTLDELLAHGKVAGSLQAGEYDWHAGCPVCGASGALRIWQRPDSTVGLSCLEGCGYGQICAALGVAAGEIGGEALASEGGGKGKRAARRVREIVARYDYQAADGAVIYQVCLSRDGGRTQRVPDPGSSAGWKWGRSRYGVPSVPYRLPKALAAVAEGRTVWIVPSERDVEALESLGLAATCALDVGDKGGGWQEDWTRWFAETKKPCVIIARKDPAPPAGNVKAALGAYKGQREAERIRVSFETAGALRRPACLVLPDRGDVVIRSPADWVNAGGTKDELFAAVKGAPLWACPDALGDLPMDVLERAAGGAPAALEKAAATSPSTLDSPSARIAAAGAPLPTAAGGAASVGGVLADSDPRSLAELRAQIIAILTNKDLDKFKRRDMMELALVQWLAGRGRFYYHAELKTHSTSLYFDAVDKRLMYISRDFFKSWLALAMRVNSESPEYRYVLSRIMAEALAGATTRGIVPERYWARRGNRVYVSCGRGRMVRCTAGGTEIVDVGTDDVLFEEGAELEPWTLLGSDGADPFEACEVFRTANTIYPRGRVLLKLWAMSLPGHGDSTKPILLLSGRARSGKTRLALSIMEMYGLPSKATMLSKTYKDTDFWTLADSGGVMCLDNADSFIEWLPGCLATVATCGSYSKKRNYTDNELITQRARCWCCVTGTQPSFAGDSGVADRLLTVELFSRAAGDTKESSLRGDVLDHRDAALTWVCRAWCRALADESYPPAAVNSRHPDWGLTAYRLARAVGIEQEAVDAMTESEASKAVFALRNDALGEHLVDAFGADGFVGSSSQMSEKLKERCDGFDGEKTWTLPKIGKALKRLEPHLVQAFGMVRTNHSGTSNYTFNPIPVEFRTPTMLGVDGCFAQSAHTGDHVCARVDSPPTSPTSTESFEESEGFDL